MGIQVSSPVSYYNQSIVRRSALAVCVAALSLCLRAQSPPSDSPPAGGDINRIRELVEQGALPRKALDDAREALQDTRDEEILRNTLYGKMTLEQFDERQAGEMLDAAERHFQRRQQKLDAAKKLVDEGVRPPASLVPFLEELDRGRGVRDSAAARKRVFDQLAEMVRAEQDLEARLEEAARDELPGVDRFDGTGIVHASQWSYLERTFELEFRKALPVSAKGETVLHISLGFDHRGRIDVALHPDSREGIWMRRHLEMLKVPYVAFRGAVPGQATGAHIHIGPPSLRIRRTD